ncbi:MAG: hypothetical protein MR871_06700 [Lachnospiraceae bacterium]|nr:hypothetical protein [Lachnospiraceae bacterium]
MTSHAPVGVRVRAANSRLKDSLAAACAMKPERTMILPSSHSPAGAGSRNGGGSVRTTEGPVTHEAVPTAA